MIYPEQYKHPLWQKKRLEILEAADWKCEFCLSKDDTLHAHHISYRREADVWDYPLSNFLSLCENCHKFIHSLNKKQQKYFYHMRFTAQYNTERNSRDNSPITAEEGKNLFAAMRKSVGYGPQGDKK